MSLEDLERELEATSEYNESSPVSTLETQKDLSPKVLAQYSIDGDGVYEATGSTTKKLPPGFYEFKEIRGRMFFSRIDSKNDRLIRIKDSLADSIMNEVNMFWSKQSIFKKYGFTHHRGYLLYGAHGSGKTCLVQMIGQDIIDAGGVVFICSYPPAFIAGIKIFRQVEPDRNCVCIFEDIEAMIKAYGDTDLLSYLDGEYKIDRALNIATTQLCNLDMFVNYSNLLIPRSKQQIELLK